MLYENGVISGTITLKDIWSLSMDEIRTVEISSSSELKFYPSFYRLPHRMLFNALTLIAILIFSIVYVPANEYDMMYYFHEWALMGAVVFWILMIFRRVYDKIANTYTVNTHEIASKSGIFVTNLTSLASSEVAGVFVHQTVLEKIMGMGGIRIQVDLANGEVRLMGIRGALKVKSFMVRMLHEGSSRHSV